MAPTPDPTTPNPTAGGLRKLRKSCAAGFNTFGSLLAALINPWLTLLLLVEKQEKRKRWSGYVLLRLNEQMKAELDEAANALGVGRTELVRMIVANYIALVKLQRMHPTVALLFPYPLPRPQAPAELPAGAEEVKRGDEPQEKSAGEVGAGG